jgi:flagellar motor switch protein FliN
VIDEDFNDTLGEVGNIMMGAGATNLAGLLGSQVMVTTPTIRQGPPVDAWPEGRALKVEVSMIGAIDGDSMFVLPEADVAFIVKLMCAGMEISEDEIFGEMGLSAVGEAMNQLMAGAAIALSDVLGELVDITPPVLTMTEGSSLAGQIEADRVSIVFEIFIGDQFHGQLSWIMAPGLSTQLVDRVMEGMGGGSGQSAVETTLNEVVSSAESVAAAPEPVQAAPVPPSPAAATAPAPAMAPAAVAVQPVTYPDLAQSAAASLAPADLSLLADVSLTVTVELGHTAMIVKDVLQLSEGSIVELDRPAGAPVDVLINGTLVARGDVVVVDDELGVRVSEVLDPSDRPIS